MSKKEEPNQNEENINIKNKDIKNKDIKNKDIKNKDIKDKNIKDKDDMTIEQAFTKLQETVSKLENPDISLEDSFLVYKEGMDLLKYCNDSIDLVEKKVMKINEKGELDEF